MKQRDNSLSKKIMKRDLGICRCCGFKAHEAHHIIPLVYGGGDDVTNMIALCGTCHTHAPDTKAKFYEYMLRGGAKTEMLLGKIVGKAFHEESKSNGEIKAIELISLGRKILIGLRQCEYNGALQSSNLKESLEIEDVDFKDYYKLNKEMIIKNA